MLDILRKVKYAVRKIALKRLESGSKSHALEIWYIVLMSKTPWESGQKEN